MEPFRELLKKPSDKSVYWDSQLQTIFETTQRTISQLTTEGLQYYDVTRPTAVFTDYSRLGISVIIMQQYCQCVTQETPTVLQGWLEIGALWQSPFDISRAELLYAGGRSLGHCLVLEEGAVVPPGLPEPDIRHGPSRANQDFSG